MIRNNEWFLEDLKCSKKPLLLIVVRLLGSKLVQI